MSWNLFTDEEEEAHHRDTPMENLLPSSLRDVWDESPGPHQNLHHPSLPIMTTPRSPTPTFHGNFGANFNYGMNNSTANFNYSNKVDFVNQPSSYATGQPVLGNVAMPSSAPTLGLPVDVMMTSSSPLNFPTPNNMATDLRQNSKGTGGISAAATSATLFNPSDVLFQGEIEQDGKTATSNYYQVQFTPIRSAVFNAPPKLSLNIGDYVLTEADRGYDVGRVTANIKKPSQRDMKNLKMIVRLASQHEIAQLPMKAERESKALALCQAKVAEMRIPMEVTAAEFQFDGKKLTFYYTATSYVDFRMLVRTLFRIFSTRIWMCCTNDNKNNAAPIQPNNGHQ